MKITYQFSKYGGVALISAFSDYATFAILSWFAFGPVPAQMSARLVGGVFSFAANKYWSFEAGGYGRLIEEGRRFLLLYIVSYVLSLSLFTLLLEGVGLAPLFAKVVADSVCFILNFVTMKLYVFSGVDGIAARLRGFLGKI